MISILICDNNPIFADYLKQEVAQLVTVPCRITVCHSSEELREYCKTNSPQVALMDIQLGSSEETGITLARELFPAGSKTSVIFITGYVEYVSDVYEADHVYFIRKPVETSYLKRALDKALEEPQTKGSVFPVQIHGTTQLIDLREVLCVESFYRKLRFRLWDETIECYGSFSVLPEMVTNALIQCHKSFLVNPDYIRSMDRQYFLLKDGSSVPISRSRYSDSRQAFLDYCTRHLGN